MEGWYRYANPAVPCVGAASFTLATRPGTIKFGVPPEPSYPAIQSRSTCRKRLAVAARRLIPVLYEAGAPDAIVDLVTCYGGAPEALNVGCSCILELSQPADCVGGGRF